MGAWSVRRIAGKMCRIKDSESRKTSGRVADGRIHLPGGTAPRKNAEEQHMQRQLTTVALVIGLGISLLGGLPTEALRPPGDEGPPIDDVPPEDPGPPIDGPPDCGPLSPVMRVTRTTPPSCFIKALGTDHNLVLLEHDVELDLTGYANISIARGVTLTSAAPPPPPIGHAPPTLAARLQPVLPRDPWAPNPAEYTVARDARHRGPRVYTRTPPTHRCRSGGCQTAQAAL